MAITGKIQDATAAALSAIEEALDLNEPEAAAGKDGAKSEKPKSEKPSIAAAMGASVSASAGVSASSKPDGESAKKADIDIDTNPTLNLQLPRPAKPADKGAARPADKPADKPAEPFAATRPGDSAASAQKPAAAPTQPRSPVPGFSTPAKPASGSATPAPKPGPRQTRRRRAKTGEARADDAARQRRPPQHRRVARRAELPPERNDHRHDGAVDHRLDGAVDALRLFPPREHFGRGRQFSGADADTDAARAVRADRVPVRHRHHGPPRP